MAFVTQDPRDDNYVLVEPEIGDHPGLMKQFLSGQKLESGQYRVNFHEAVVLMDGRFELDDALEPRFQERERIVSIIGQLKQVAPYRRFDQIPNFCAELREHQHNAVYALTYSTGFVNADEVGTGKSIETVAACCLHGEHAIIVCESKKGLDWEDEFITKSSLRVIRIKKNSGPEKRKKLYQEFLESDAKILITTYEKVRPDVHELEKLVRFRRTRLYVDEADRLKNVLSQTNRTIMSLGELCSGRYALTGTPYGSKLIEYYAIMRFVQPAVAPDWTLFQDRHCVVHQNGYLLGRYRNVAEFKRRFSSFVINRSKHEIERDYGNRRYDFLWKVQLSDETRDLYDELARKILIVREQLKSMHKSGALAKKPFRDRQTHLAMQQLRIVISPYLEGINSDIENDKYRALSEIMTWCRARGLRAIIFSRWASTIDWIEANDPAWTWLDGRAEESQRGPLEARIAEFKNGHHDAIITTSALQKGQNFPMCNVTIHLDMPATALAFDQRNGRVTRGERDKTTYNFYIMADKTREMKLFTDMRSHLVMADHLGDKKNHGSGSIKIREIQSIQELET